MLNLHVNISYIIAIELYQLGSFMLHKLIGYLNHRCSKYGLLYVLLNFKVCRYVKVPQ